MWDWESGFTTIEGVAHKHLQDAYTVLHKTLQHEWSLVQGDTQGLGEEFRPVEKAFWEELLLDLFLGVDTYMPRWTITRLPVKQYGLAIPDPIQTAQGNWIALYVFTGHLIADLSGRLEFRLWDHTELLIDTRVEIWRWKIHEVGGHLIDVVEGLSLTDGRRLFHGQKTGICISVTSYMVNRTELSTQEWRDAVLLRYGIEPPDLPWHCNGYSARFLIAHKLY